MHKILISGALGGIGQKLCEFFSDQDWYVIGMDINAGENIQFCNESLSTDLNRLCHDEEYRKKEMSKIVKACNGLKALINNAAVQILDSTENINLEDWQETINVNLTGPLLLSQALLTELEKEKGSIINIGSIHHQLTKRKFVSYATSKSALVGLTKSLAVDLQGRVRVNCISPAAVETDMLRAGFDNNEAAINELRQLHPMQKIGSPDEVAQCALFLTSDRVKFLNGANLQLDGGISSVLNDIRE